MEALILPTLLGVLFVLCAAGWLRGWAKDRRAEREAREAMERRQREEWEKAREPARVTLPSVAPAPVARRTTKLHPSYPPQNSQKAHQAQAPAPAAAWAPSDSYATARVWREPEPTSAPAACRATDYGSDTASSDSGSSSSGGGD